MSRTTSPGLGAASETISYALPEHLARREAAQRRERFIQLAAVAVAAVSVAAAGMMLAPVNEIRRTRQMLLDPDSVKGLPPDVALLSKTGTFRALALDLAFIRSEKLKEQGKYYEAMELASLICKLAPRFPSVWAYNAWNQAYNISVTQYSPEARWQWVRNGIALLRDEGIQYNPKAVGLYKELAYIFWHKIGDFLDDQHWNYKAELAVEMERVLGPPAVALSTADTIDAFRKIAQAPRDLPALIREDREIGALVSALRRRGLSPDIHLLDFVARNLRDELHTGQLLKKARQDPDDVFNARLLLLTDPKFASGRDRLLAALRSRILRDNYHMDLDWMLELMERYGPLDWRSPYALSLYWASWGDKVTKGYINLDENDAMNTVRFIFFALNNCWNRGRIMLEPNFDKPNASVLTMARDLRFIPFLHQAYLDLGREQFGDDPRFVPGTAGPNYRTGHFNFLHFAIKELFLESSRWSLDLAQRYYAYLRQYNVAPDGNPQQQYMLPLEDFVMRDVYAAFDSSKNAATVIEQFCVRSLRELAAGNVEASVGYMNVAGKGWKWYMDHQMNLRNRRADLEPLLVFRRDAVLSVMQDASVSLIAKTRLWHGLELTMRQATHDRLVGYLTELCKKSDPPLDVHRAFPEPPGMAEYRRNPITALERDNPDQQEGRIKK